MKKISKFLFVSCFLLFSSAVYASASTASNIIASLGRSVSGSVCVKSSDGVCVTVSSLPSLSAGKKEVEAKKPYVKDEDLKKKEAVKKAIRKDLEKGKSRH